MTISNDDEFHGLRRVGRLVAQTLDVMEEQIRRSIDGALMTADLDHLARDFARAAGARSAPQLTYGFPGFTCISVNDEIVHGIPGTRVLQRGDIVSVDVTLELDGYMADSARTVVAGASDDRQQPLIAAARTAFEHGRQAARVNRRLCEVGRAVERSARRDGAFVLRDLCGHGIGRRLHEAPEVPNWGDPRARTKLHEGLVFALEPMLCASAAKVVEQSDGWTLRTSNRCLAAHHEHTVVVRAGGPALILTAA